HRRRPRELRHGAAVMNRRLRAVAILAAVLALTTAARCGPSGSGPADNRPGGGPPPAAPSVTPGPEEHEVYFVGPVYGVGGRPLGATVTLTDSAIQADGYNAINPNTGTRRPLVIVRTTPHRYGMSFLGPVVMGSETVLYLGHPGEAVACWVEK